MAHYRDVVKILGEDKTHMHHNYAWQMSGDDLVEFARQLGGEKRPEVNGKHMTRVEGTRPKDLDKSAEMRQMLSDWYNSEMYAMDQNKAVEKLVSNFTSPELVTRHGKVSELMQSKKESLREASEDKSQKR